MLQVALNGVGGDERMPRTPREIASDAAASVRAGATSIHLHAFDAHGVETFAAPAVAEVLRAVREACPGIPLNMTTFAQIEPDPEARHRAIAAWTELPDLIPVNVGEIGVDAIARTLLERGVRLEACLLSVDAAHRFVAEIEAFHWERVFVEPVHPVAEVAIAESIEIERILRRAEVRLEQVHHGAGPAAWAVLASAAGRRHGVRIGLEDTGELPDGAPARDNADLVRAARGMIDRIDRLAW
jgi:uncharacterized protein (DUF849 family)